MTQKQIDSLSIVQRAKAPTPNFFQKVKVIGLVLAAVSGALIATPIALPAIVTTVAGYLAAAGSVAAAISQVTVKG